MVRRWSYLNSYSMFASRDYYVTTFVYGERSSRANLKFRGAISMMTRFHRRVWARRYHQTVWVPYTNIFADWAREYRFFKVSARFWLAKDRYRFSALSFNYIALRNSIAAIYKGTELVNIAPVISRVFNYAKPAGSAWISTADRLGAVSWAFVSATKAADLGKGHTNSTFCPYFLDNRTDLVPFQESYKSVDPVQGLLTTFSLMWFRGVIDVYTLFIYLVLANFN